MCVCVCVCVCVCIYKILMVQKERTPFHLATSLIGMYGVFVSYLVMEILLCLKLYLGELNVFYFYFPRVGYYTLVHHKQHVWVL